MNRAPPLLELRGIRKVFPNGTVALRGADLNVRSGSVHGLLGANGAGKSTLIKILSGALEVSGGGLFWKGAPVRWTRPIHAKAAGIATLYQHVPLVPTLSVLENVLLGSKGTWRQRAEDRERVGAILDEVGYAVDLDAPVASLSIGQRQMVAILQALSGGADLVVMDEPTASLSNPERRTVHRIVRQLAGEQGKAVLFVSHFIDEIIALTDEVTVLRDGRATLNAPTDTLSEEAIAEAIAGREVVTLEREHRAQARGEVVVEARRIASPGTLAETNLTVARGEIVGIAGMLGSGRSELLHALFGADPAATGELWIEGERLGPTAEERVAAGVALVPEDRAEQGYVPAFTIAENISLPTLRQFSGAGLLPRRSAEHAASVAAIERLSIKAPGPDTLVTELSGGNAQKVVIAKWLTGHSRFLLLDEPTAGIDIGARTDVLRLIRRAADDGLPVLLVSSEFHELLALCDRILVMRDGAVVAERRGDAITEQELILLAGSSANPDAGAVAA